MVAATGAIVGAGLLAGGALGGAAISANAAGDAAEQQAEAAQDASQVQLQAQREAIAAQREQFDITRGDLEPWRQAGTFGLDQLLGGFGQGGRFNESFGLDDFEADPGYQFRLSEGQKAIERSASSRGGVLSGRTLKELSRYGQGVAGDEYSRAYARFNDDRTREFNRLGSLAGLGQTATISGANLGQSSANALSGIFSGTGANLSEIALQAGNARAGATAAQGQIYGNLVNNLGALPQQYQTLQSLGLAPSFGNSALFRNSFQGNSSLVQPPPGVLSPFE